ncbi:MAG: class I SAM-dependent rRNA methyltransferase, partial [Acidobacteria bacterium]|nr:class I SAM-dependent rRNA methyltransferase [Acidobacteriota bacterium]
MRHSPAGPAPPLLTVDNPAPPLVRISRKGADRAASGHPWIFRSDVLEHAGARPGDVVKVVDPRGATLGTAHYSSTSQICLRLLSIRDEPITREFFDRRLAAALDYRAGIVPPDTDVWRMVYGEADQLPALIIDRYGRYAVLQTLSQGMDRAQDVFVRGLLGMGFAGIVERNDVAVRAKEALPLKSGVLAGEVPGAIDVLMNGLPWRADLLHAQKTGIFLDQRENYLAVAGYARGRALDCFT